LVNFFPVFPNLVVVYIRIVRYNFNVRQKIITIIVFTSLLSIILAFIPTSISFANGGDQRVVEGKYLINLSRSPFTPKAGENVSMLASFVDIQTDKLITENLIVKIRIAKLGEGRERKFLFKQENLIAKGGILEFQHIFQDAGLHEIFFDFAFAANPEEIYNAPDFLLDIQKSKIDQKSTFSSPIGIMLGAIFGFMIGWFIKRRNV